MARVLHGPQNQSPKKIEFISLDNSFHGRTFGALSITGQEKYRRDFEPLVQGVRFCFPGTTSPRSSRSPAIAPPPSLRELVQGEGGIYPLSADYVRAARELADRAQRAS